MLKTAKREIEELRETISKLVSETRRALVVNRDFHNRFWRVPGTSFVRKSDWEECHTNAMNSTRDALTLLDSVDCQPVPTTAK